MKKETKIYIAVVVVVVIVVAAMYYYDRYRKAKAAADASKEFVDYVHGTAPQNVEYPAIRDLSGFDDGDVLTYKGNKFKANLTFNRWDLIPA